jgi:Holliday junction DNA helicase RuvA
MIGRLRGKLLHKAPPSLVIDVAGVGYEIEAPMTTFYDLPAVGESVTLHTHLLVRDDALLLYGFSREGQRRLFRALLKVSGIGPRVALAILSGLSEEEFRQCINNEDVDRLRQAPGIGRKTAERLVVELRGKQWLQDIQAHKPGTAPAPEGADPASEAVSALVALGYKPSEAQRAVQGIAGGGLSTEEIIRQALRRVAG